MSVFTTANPVTAGAIGSRDQFDAVFENTKALKQGDVALDFLSLSQIPSTLTGTVDNWDPGTGAVVAWAGASALTVRGIVAHIAGDLRIIRNDTATLTITVNHQDGTSTATNRIILKSGGTLVIPPGGTAGFYYDSTASRWREIFFNAVAEGAWTPSITSAGGGAATYQAAGQNGYFHRRDSLVHVQGYIHLATLGTLAAGVISISGLPFPCSSASSAFTVLNMPYWAGMASTFVSMGGFISPSASVASIIGRQTAGATIANLTVADLGATAELIFQMSYRTSP